VAVRPFKNNLVNLSEIMNEITILGASYSVVAFSNFNLSGEVKFHAGIGIIMLATFILILNFGAVVVYFIIKAKGKLCPSKYQ
jgi:hypothetical protein